MTGKSPGARAAPGWVPPRLPLLTLLLCALAGLLLLLPPELQEPLYFNREALSEGRVIGLLTGHWMHADSGHLYWNMLALAVLGAVIEAHSRKLLLQSLLMGMLSVDTLLLSPLCNLGRYCGLSGLLNTLLAIALCLRWRQTRSPLIACIAIVCMLKLVVELFSGESLLTDISWAPYAPAHVAGLLGAGLMLVHARATGSRFQPGIRG